MTRCWACRRIVPYELFRCTHCGAVDPNREENITGGAVTKNKTTTLDQIEAVAVQRIWTGGEWDEAWSGFVPKSVTIVSAPPGVGKTTILLQIAAKMAEMMGKRAYYLSSEQSPSEIKLTTDRLGLDPKLFRVLTAMGGGADVSEDLLKADPPSSLTVDSVTGLCGRDLNAAWSVVKSFKKLADKWNIPVFLICHVNKSHDIAGLMGLQHECDVTMTFDRIDKKMEKDLIADGYHEDDLAGDIRALCAWKNRYGPENKIIPLLMTARGLVALPKREEDKTSKPRTATPPPPSPVATEIGRSIHPTSQDEIEIKGDILPKRKKRQPKPLRAEAIEGSAPKRGRPEMKRAQEGKKAARQRRKEARA